MIVGVSEAKTRLSRLLDAAARGEQVVITRRGKPVAMLVPPPPTEDRDMRRIIDEMLRVRSRTGPRLRGLRIRDLIVAGRRR